MAIDFGKVITRKKIDDGTTSIVTEGYYDSELNTLETEHEIQRKTSKASLLSDLLDCITYGKDSPVISISIKRGKDGQPAMIITRFRVEKKYYGTKHMV